MLTFDDFDAWGDAVSGASLRLVCDGVEQRRWTLGVVDLGTVMVQVASEGGGNICYGGNTHEGPILFVPLSHASEQVVNGEPLDDESLLAIPCGADFRIRVRRRAHSWCSIALPAGVAGPSMSGRLSCGRAAVSRLRQLVGDVTTALLDRPAGSAAHHAAARDLLAVAAALLPGRTELPAAVGRPPFDRAAVIRRAMAALDGAVSLPTAADLAAEVGVTGRTLLRTFQEVFGLSPKQYLLLRELHAVRRSFRAGDARNVTVADVLTRHGIWEFGRFAARYRRQFGELPSETLRRARA